MIGKPQTAIRGVFSVGATNVVVRLLGYGKHVLIAAFIGLSTQLDAFYMAFTILSLVILSYGDVFDSLGVPRLVEALRREDEESFNNLAGNFLVFSFLLSLVLGGILLLVAPWASAIAPGFSPEKKEFVYRNLILLYPIVFFYLPHHAIGSFLRSRRRFLTFYLGELVFAVVSLLIIFVWRDFPYVVPVSVTGGTLAGFLYVCLAGRTHFRFIYRVDRFRMQEIALQFFRLLPLYLIGYLYLFVDRAFASFLPTGGVSALSYAMLIVMIPSSILIMENVFVTPLAEADERGQMMKHILNGIILMSVPIAIFTMTYSKQIVKVGLERGVFTAASTDMTADALRYFAIAIPAIFLSPIMYRLFQILGRLRGISIVGIISVILNAVLNYLFLKMGSGIKGLALATTVSYYIGICGYFLLLRRLGFRLMRKEVFPVLLIAIISGVLSCAMTFLIPIDPGTLLGMITVGGMYLFAVALFYYLTSNEEIRFWRDTVIREIIPFRK
jgi:putative peptidoglycan lipid II flippase